MKKEIRKRKKERKKKGRKGRRKTENRRTTHNFKIGTFSTGVLLILFRS
jgi:hypothetical protein